MAGLRDNRYGMPRSTAILLLATAMLAGTTLWSWRALMAERARADALQAQLDEQATPVAAAAAALPAGAEVPAYPAGGGIETEAEPKSKNPEIFGDQRRLLGNETYREATRRLRSLRLRRGYVDLAKVLGISQQTADRLLEMLLEKELENLERPQFNPRNEKEARIRQLEIQQARLERNAEVAAVIGAANLPKWEQYEASLPIRHEVREMAGNVFGPVDPLRDDQGEALIRVMHAERQRVRQELSEFTESLTWTDGLETQSHIYRGERYGELTDAANERIHESASAFLSAGQLAALDERLRRERELQEAEFQEVRAMMEAGEVSDDEANLAARRSRQP